MGFSKINVDSWAVNAAQNKLYLIFENRAGKEIKIKKVKVKNEIEKTTTLNLILGDGEKNSNPVSLDCPPVNSGESYRFKVIIDYCFTEYGEEPTFSSSGTLIGVA